MADVAVTKRAADSELEPESDENGLDKLAQSYAVMPGEARHGVDSLRGVFPFEVRAADGEDHIGILNGHFAVFSRWTEIDSFWEGRFLEQIAPGAFKKTFQENLKGMRCLFQHGRDPQLGMKPLGSIREVEEDDIGARYDVPLFDAGYVRELLPGLKANQYGASFRFQVIREEVNSKPERSDHNPEGIEERTVTECKVREFGPVTFGAYEDATAGVRSRSLIESVLEIEFGEVNYAHLTRSSHYYYELLRAADGSNGHANATGPSNDSESSDEAAPPTDAPEGPRVVRSTRLAGAARTLRTSRNLEVPQWKL